MASATILAVLFVPVFFVVVVRFTGHRPRPSAPGVPPAAPAAQGGDHA